MSSTPGMDPALTVASPATPSPSLKAFDFDFTGSNYEMDPSISEEERRFYLKMYPTVDVVNQRKVHCTVCRMHLGTAVSTENNIKMHPILRVTHCIKCHDFYNSGEFSKGEDGSELYCRWCGQGGEVYCCSTCPYVFCKSCIIKNLSRGVIVDIEQNENWNCFKCTSKILWPLRAQHWALVNYIQTQKNGLQSLQLSESEMRKQTHKDYSTCCRLAKAKVNSLSDSMESLESNTSKRSHSSSVNSGKKSAKPQGPPAKRPKSSNDDIVCTPDLLSMLEPDCQISVAQKPAPRSNITPASAITTTPRIVTVQQNYTGPRPSTNGSSTASPRSSLPPPLVLSSSGIRYRQSTPSQASVVRRTVVPNAIRSAGPVFHTINGFRVDLNSAAQQDSYRLPNGRLIQVKRQFPAGQSPPATTTVTRAPVPLTPQVIIRQQPPTVQPPRMLHPNFGSNMGIYNPQTNQQQRAPQVVRVNNGSQVHAINVAPQPQATAGSGNSSNGGAGGGTTIMMTPASVPKAPTLVRHVFSTSPLGAARTQLQNQIFNAMEICTHLTGKVQTLTMSNAYNEARSYSDVKELYIHLSYLMTYAIGRFKQLQDKCLLDMREMGFKNDANSLENGQLAAEKQASDDEDNEIEIVEPKTDTITIDSDNEEETPSVPKVNLPKGLKITSVKSTAPEAEMSKMDPVTANIDPNEDIDVAAISSSILASLLEVDITEGAGEVKTNQATSPGGTLQKKQPRKKTTHKPNPALLQLERQRMDEMKRNDSKLKMKPIVRLVRAEEQFEVARKWVEKHGQKKSEVNADEQTMEEAGSHKERAVASDTNEDKASEENTDKEQKQLGEGDSPEKLGEEELLEPMDTSDVTKSQTDEAEKNEEDVDRRKNEKDKVSIDNENLTDVEESETETIKNQNVEAAEAMEEDTETALHEEGSENNEEQKEAKQEGNEQKEGAEPVTAITGEASKDVAQAAPADDDAKDETAEEALSHKELDKENTDNVEDEQKEDRVASEIELDKQTKEDINTEKNDDAAPTTTTQENEDATEQKDEHKDSETELAKQASEEAADKTEAQTDKDNTDTKAIENEETDFNAATRSSSQPAAAATEQEAAEIPASSSPAKESIEITDEEDQLAPPLELQYDCSASLD
ncbi:PREDICTED: uncharacterized protein LOC108616261 isoform X1 [Drosophila arizonae]|uniref:Uncharacterized protein LOC108616261 isoform X1 n=1 Tax=Drosophila arizonae TaxID=7263 RepID=A0ABM1PHZ6_DROAR|nr:PREDICTED: uncharacterized protein LOC108616261 isoform X1 [Drosophila arizonae]